jgi:DNA-directed RNA polymerase specialized sigma24 family protein
MCDDHSVSQWIVPLQAGDPQAAQQLWQRFVDRLVRLARRKLRGDPRRAADENDVVVSVFDAAFRGIKEGRFSKLSDRHDLWQILVMLTEHKAIALKRRGGALKRGRGQIRGESVFVNGAAGKSTTGGLSQFIGRECTPEFAAAAGDHLAHLLASLPDDSLRSVALGKLAGYTNPELSEQLGLSLRAVERKLNLIRREWESKVVS